MMSGFSQLINHAGFVRYFINTSWLMGEKILRMAISLFVGVWVVRYLGPEQFGLLSYVQSFVFLFTAITTLGLDGIVVRELVKDESRRDILLGTAFVLKLVAAILILPALAIAVKLTSNDQYTNLLVFVVASATIFQSFNVIDFYYQSKVLSKYVTLANTVSLVFSSVIKITLILNKAPLIAFALMSLFDSIVLAIGLVYFYKKRSDLKLFDFSFDKSTAIILLKNSWPLMLSGVVITLYMKIVQIMIKEIIDIEAVGQYAAAVRLSEAWYFIPMAISSSLFPAIINAKSVSKELYYQRLQWLYTTMVWLAITIALPMVFLSEWVVMVLYGDAYQQAADVLIIHIWAGVFVFLGVAFSQYLVAENLVMKSFFRTAVGALVNIILNMILIPKYGITGAAMATLLSQLIANLIYDVFDKDLRIHLWLKLSAFLPFFLITKCSLCRFRSR